MRKLLALVLLLSPLANAADAPNYRVFAQCRFRASEEGIQLGHSIDFSAQSYRAFSEPASTQSAFSLVTWSSGPFKGQTDILLDHQNRTGLEQNWKVTAHRTANDKIHLIDVTMTPDKTGDDPKTFDQKLLVMYDTRISPMPAYITRTAGFSSEVEMTANAWVAFLTYQGTCEATQD